MKHKHAESKGLRVPYQACIFLPLTPSEQPCKIHLQIKTKDLFFFFAAYFSTSFKTAQLGLPSKNRVLLDVFHMFLDLD